MTSFTSSALLKFCSLGAVLTRRCNLTPLSFQARHIHGGSEQGVTDAVKRGVNNTLKIGENLKNKAASKTEDVFDNSNESSSGVADRAKQVAQNAWESAKGSAAGMTSKDSITAVEVDGPDLHSKDAIEIAKRSMNTKKDDNC